MINKLGSKQRYTLTRTIKKTMTDGFHAGFICGTTAKINNK